MKFSHKLQKKYICLRACGGTSNTKSPTSSPALFMACARTPAGPRLMSDAVTAGTNFCNSLTVEKWNESQLHDLGIILYIFFWRDMPDWAMNTDRNISLAPKVAYFQASL